MPNGSTRQVVCRSAEQKPEVSKSVKEESTSLTPSHHWHSPCCELDITAPALRGAPVKFGQNAGVFVNEISKLLSGFLLFHLPLELYSWNINTFSYSLLVQGGFSTQPRCQESLRWCTRDPTGLSLALHGAEMPCLVLQAVVSSPLNFQKKKGPLG